MKNTYNKILFPNYYDKFKCIADKCEESCCIGWRVTIDKDTYKKYRSISDAEIKEELYGKVKRIRTKASDVNYSRIKLNEDGRCPFLNENNFCDLYIKCGEEYLSNTCKVYPRTYNSVDDTLEVSLTMSCPHAAKLCLLNENPMEFNMEEIKNEFNDVKINKKIKTDIDYSNRLKEIFWDLRFLTINILQNRNYSLSDRLILLGLFYNNAQTLVEENKEKDVLDLIDKYKNNIANGLFDESLKNIPSLDEYQFKIIKEIADSRFMKGISSARYKECYIDFLLGLNIQDGAEQEVIFNTYKGIRKEYFDDFLSKNEHVLENYIVNLVFRNMFPMYSKSIFEDYVMLIVRYAYIKAIAIGMCGKHKESFDRNHLVKIIQTFSRSVEHNNGFLNEINELLKKNGINTIAHMAILIK